MLVAKYSVVAEFSDGTESCGRLYDTKEEALEYANQLKLPHDDFICFVIREYYYVRNEGQEL